MAKMSFDEEGLLAEPCLSCDKPRLDDLFYEWYCDEKECLYKGCDRWCNTCEFKHLESECLGCSEYDEYDNVIKLRNYKKEETK